MEFVNEVNHEPIRAMDLLTEATMVIAIEYLIDSGKTKEEVKAILDKREIDIKNIMYTFQSLVVNIVHIESE